MASNVLCGECGAEGDPSDRFCGSCGAVRSSADRPATPVAPNITTPFSVDVPSGGSPNTGSDGGILRADVADPAGVRPAVKESPPRLTARSPVAATVGPSRDHLVGEAVPNSTYLGQRLLYEKPPEPSFDPIRNTRWMAQALLHAALFWFFWFVTGFVFFVLCILLLVVSRSSAIFGLYAVGAIVSGIAFTLIWFFRPLPAVLSEWKFAVDDKGAAETTAFEHIAWSFGQRQTPVKSVRIRRISQPGVPTRDYLEVKDGIFSGYVSCFAYGNDLYIGWTFWLYLSPFRWLLVWFRTIYLTFTLRGSELYGTLRYDSARAMREALHAACREGVDVAAGEIEARGQGIVGSEVGIDLTTLASSD